jgi:hypothetical protein
VAGRNAIRPRGPPRSLAHGSSTCRWRAISGWSTRRRARVDVTADLATIDAYKERLAAWKQGFADLAARRGATYVDVPTTVPLNDLVFAELRRRRVVA